jgi:hypothetical protein
MCGDRDTRHARKQRAQDHDEAQAAATAGRCVGRLGLAALGAPLAQRPLKSALVDGITAGRILG